MAPSISLDKFVLPLGRTEAQSDPREDFSLWRSFSFDTWESEAQRGQELAREHTAVLRYESSHQQMFDPELFSLHHGQIPPLLQKEETEAQGGNMNPQRLPRPASGSEEWRIYSRQG